VDSLTVSLAPSAHIPWRIRRGNSQFSPKNTATPGPGAPGTHRPTDRGVRIKGIEAQVLDKPTFRAPASGNRRGREGGGVLVENDP
jgi:hypothetical protein